MYMVNGMLSDGRGHAVLYSSNESDAVTAKKHRVWEGSSCSCAYGLRAPGDWCGLLGHRISTSGSRLRRSQLYAIVFLTPIGLLAIATQGIAARTRAIKHRAR